MEDLIRLILTTVLFLQEILLNQLILTNLLIMQSFQIPNIISIFFNAFIHNIHDITITDAFNTISGK